jgi:23S rRNA U2552 (ribose-2'-O)-methylase RlmE/FtsJ
MLSSLGLTFAPPNVRSAVSDFTRGITTYLAKHYKLPVSPSNAFTKLWEIYASFEFLIPKDTNLLKMLHICEAPGQWIITTKYFISKKRRNITVHDWRANSLNPFNPENLDAYGTGVFDDKYGFMKKYYNQWLWGADNTGDITRRRNVLWFRDYVKKWVSSDGNKMNLMVGDGGLSTEENATLLQRLDVGQMVMVMACLSVGGHCVMKHFTPYIKRHESTYNASGFFIGFLYVYFLLFSEVYLFKPNSSNPDSGEFYVVGKNFYGCSNELLEKLLAFQDKFKLNSALFKLEDIPDSFVNQVNGFLDTMSHYNANAIDKQIMLLTCVQAERNKNAIILKGVNKDIIEKMKCNRFLNPEKLYEIQEPRYKKWIAKYNFQ